MEVLLACPVCQSNEVSVFLEGEDRELVAAAVGSSRVEVSPGRILRCGNCRLGFRQARPSEEELAHVYRQLDPVVYEAEAPGRAQTARLHLGIVQRYAKPGRLLDLGCASGAFLRCAAEAGWRVTGVEPARDLYEKAQALLAARGEVVCATLQEARLPAGAFDVVTLWDVLEHVRDPVGFMSAATTFLKPRGHLMLNVPDLNSPQARWLGPRWPLLLPEHLNYFTRQSLLKCAGRAGMVVLEFGRRRASFSVQYVAYRLQQHGIPGMRIAYRLLKDSPLGRLMVRLHLGELCAVLQKAQ